MLASNSFLVKVAKGEIDLNLWAKFVVVERGLDFNSKWIGFDNLKLSNPKLP